MNPERKAYETSVKLPGWNIRPSLGFELDTATRRRIIRKLLPGMTAEQYRERASYHAGREMIARDNYMRAVRAAFGFDPSPTNYRVSAVWNESFSTVEKARLRRWNAAINYHADMRRAFEAATKYRRAA